jgi:hypothetical protein
MDRAHESNETREFAKELGFNPVVPPKRNRKNRGTATKIVQGTQRY